MIVNWNGMCDVPLLIRRKGPSIVLCYGARRLSVRPSVRPALAKSCPLINFKLISPRYTILGIMNCHDP